MIEQDLAAAAGLYAKLAEQVSPGQGAGGRRPAPGSRPPLRIEVVSHMAELERYLAWWIGEARHLLGHDSR